LKKAFTLIELLVVIAIIAILAAILFPVFAQAKAAAKNTASLSNIKQITIASQMYSADADDVVPLAADWNNGVTWAMSTEPYRKNFAIMYSPAGGPKARSNWMTIFTDPRYNWIGNWQWFAQYGINAQYMNRAATCDEIGLDGKVFGNPISSTEPAAPAETIMFTETGMDAPEDNVGTWLVYAPGGFQADDVCTYDDWGQSSTVWTGVGDGNTTKTQAGLVRPRSSGGANVSFIDGHAKTMKLGAIANGTNWKLGLAEGGAAIVDRSKYLWDLQ
jgi:prepilin-type N-terminal cleavage/methylation domain-containing protein/prepilin-type processing-associated H-X9-DG protein